MYDEYKKIKRGKQRMFQIFEASKSHESNVEHQAQQLTKKAVKQNIHDRKFETIPIDANDFLRVGEEQEECTLEGLGFGSDEGEEDLSPIRNTQSFKTVSRDKATFLKNKQKFANDNFMKYYPN